MGMPQLEIPTGYSPAYLHVRELAHLFGVVASPDNTYTIVAMDADDGSHMPAVSCRDHEWATTLAALLNDAVMVEDEKQAKEIYRRFRDRLDGLQP